MSDDGQSGQQRRNGANGVLDAIFKSDWLKIITLTGTLAIAILKLGAWYGETQGRMDEARDLATKVALLQTKIQELDTISQVNRLRVSILWNRAHLGAEDDPVGVGDGFSMPSVPTPIPVPPASGVPGMSGSGGWSGSRRR